MVGSVDEFYAVSQTQQKPYSHGRLQLSGTGHIVLCGFTDTEAARRKCYIWYASLRIAIERSLIMPNVKYRSWPVHFQKRRSSQGKHGFNTSMIGMINVIKMMEEQILSMMTQNLPKMNTLVETVSCCMWSTISQFCMQLICE